MPSIHMRPPGPQALTLVSVCPYCHCMDWSLFYKLPVNTISARFYSVERNSGTRLSVSCHLSQRGRHYAAVETIFQARQYQKHVHSCFVYAHSGGLVHPFAVFCANDVRLPINHSVPGLCWRGDILVMRCGIQKEMTFVNLRHGDLHIIDQIVNQ